MSRHDFDPALLRRLAELRLESPRFSTTTVGLAIENEMYRAMLDDIDEGEDLWEVIDDVLAAASMLAATLTLSRHNVEMCRPCMAQVLLCFSEHVSGELAAYEALNEPDEPSEIPPFSGSIN